VFKLPQLPDQIAVATRLSEEVNANSAQEVKSLIMATTTVSTHQTTLALEIQSEVPGKTALLVDNANSDLPQIKREHHASLLPQLDQIAHAIKDMTQTKVNVLTAHKAKLVTKETTIASIQTTIALETTKLEAATS